MQNNYIYHHGIKGQRWGIRRFENEDGSLTTAGKKRYGVDENGNQSKEGKKLQKQEVKIQKKIDNPGKEAIKTGFKTYAAFGGAGLLTSGVGGFIKGVGKNKLNDAMIITGASLELLGQAVVSLGGVASVGVGVKSYFNNKELKDQQKN